MSLPERQTDVGPPHFEKFLPPVIKKNYGKWKSHEVLTPGTMVHTAESGDQTASRSGEDGLVDFRLIEQPHFHPGEEHVFLEDRAFKMIDEQFTAGALPSAINEKKNKCPIFKFWISLMPVHKVGG